jgi:hypothetical protein
MQISDETATAATSGESAAAGMDPLPTEEKKPLVKPMMFKPLSVARKSQKKRPVKPPPTSSSASAETAASSRAHDPESQLSTGPASRKSLFSLSSDDPPGHSSAASHSKPYEPLLYTPVPEPDTTDQEEPLDDDTNFVPISAPSQQSSSAPKYNTNPSLSDVASDLNLSRSAKRQLLGRNGTLGAAQVLEFNTDKEYAANDEFRRNNDANAVHNPVKAIAPGKHSLKQLVTAASGQRDALEESFAAGRRNRKEAGSKYGW